MSSIPSKKLMLVAFLSLFCVGGISGPTPFPEDQYVKHAMQKRASLQVLKTTTTKAQIIDWISIESQGQIAQPPPPRAKLTTKLGANDFWPVAELEHPGVELGPAGTVPVPRVSEDYLNKVSSQKNSLNRQAFALKNKRQDAGDHWYVSAAQNVINLGGRAFFSLFKTFVQSSADWSAIQIAAVRLNVPIPRAPPGVGGPQTVEAGWITYPDQISEPHLFTYFTTNAYTRLGNNLGGWNQEVIGWVQVDATYFPGTVFNTTSVIGGPQYVVDLEYNLHEGNWWLWVNDRWIGYYPGSMYSAGQANANDTLAVTADSIYFWGGVVQSENNLTTTDMGSGEYAAAGYGYSAYIRNMRYNDSSTQYQDFVATFTADTQVNYTVDAHIATGEDWGSYAFLGGPGGEGVVNG